MPDVVVIGAGLAGLACARDLAASGADVLVVEARERPGGRTERIELEGGAVDGGGELVGSFHEPLRRLIEELGLELEPAHPSVPGQPVWLLDDHRIVGDVAELVGDSEATLLEQVDARMAEAAQQIDPAEPWAAPDAARLDGLSLASYARELGASDAVVELWRLVSLALASDAPERTSALAVLRRYATGYSPLDLATWETDRVAGGTFQVAERMAEELGDRIRYRAGVIRIGVHDRGIEINLSSGESLRGDRCVSTIPAGVLHAIALDGVDDQVARATARLRHARAAKVVLQYERSFWQDEGLNGGSSSSRTIGSTWEQRPGVLSCLVPPERVAYFGSLSPQRRREEALDHVAALFGEEAYRPVDTAIHLWAEDPHTRGYVAWPEPGALTAMGDTLVRTDGRLLFAGSDIASVTGYMTGAVETGRRAAQALAGAAV